MLRLDVRLLQRKEWLMPGRLIDLNWSSNGTERGSIKMRTDADHVTLIYRSRSNGDDWQQMEYPVRLAWTACNLGGKRAWFLCPKCGKRVAILFGGAVFACRHCHKLNYQCQREASHDRASRRADRIRERLGWEPGILNGNGSKPKGMHWRTFERLTAEHDAHVGVSLAGMMKMLGIVEGELEAANRLADRYE
ncbi:MAG: hypothetical protein WBO88_16060 [Candidatus Dechloromonas phosphoritropha]|jgi:predicted RNA-binding Zn-ribbon protein involved in translation (DUF1610 family)